MVSTKIVGMEFGIEKCAMLIRRSGKLYMMERIELPNQEKIRMLKEKEIYKYLGDEGKNLKRVSQENEETTYTETI